MTLAETTWTTLPIQPHRTRGSTGDRKISSFPHYFRLARPLCRGTTFFLTSIVPSSLTPYAVGYALFVVHPLRCISSSLVFPSFLVSIPSIFFISLLLSSSWFPTPLYGDMLCSFFLLARCFFFRRSLFILLSYVDSIFVVDFLRRWICFVRSSSLRSISSFLILSSFLVSIPSVFFISSLISSSLVPCVVARGSRFVRFHR